MNKFPNKFKAFSLSLIRIIRHKSVVPVKMQNKTLQHKYMEYNRNRFYGSRKYFCYAPFGSIFISYNGRVSPCYACKAGGSLTETTLNGIWHGKEYIALRDAFRKGEIPEACSFCKDHLINGNYGSILANKYDHYMMTAKEFPIIAELELSNICNLECIMCSGTLSSSIRKNREKQLPVAQNLPNNFSEQFLPFLKKLKVLELTGGDPFMIDLYYEILDSSEKLNPNLNFLVTTNANTINEKVAVLLEKNLKLSFNVSIDSLEDKTYSKIRCNGSLNKALRNIEYFSAYTKKHKTSLGFLVCPLRQNWKELPSFVSFANSYQATLSYHVVFKPAQHALWSLEAKQLEDIVAYLSSFHFEECGFVSAINIRSYNALVKLVQSWYIKALQREEKQKNTAFHLASEIEKSKKTLHQMIQNQSFFDKLQNLISQLPVIEFPEMVYLILVQKKAGDLMAAFEHFTTEELLHKLTLYHQEVYTSYFYQLELSDNDKYSENIL